MLMVYATDRWDVDEWHLEWHLRVCPDVEAAKDYCARKHAITADMWVGEESFWRAVKEDGVNYVIEPILVHNMGDEV